MHSMYLHNHYTIIINKEQDVKNLIFNIPQ